MYLPWGIELLWHPSDSQRRRWVLSAVSVGLIAIAPLGLGMPITVAQLPNPSVIGNEQEINVLFVNPITGDDTKGNGKERSPLKTIAKALEVAQPNTVILLSPGVYSTETGETFPLMMKPGVTIQGNPRTRGEGIVIQGGGIFNSPSANNQTITILAANQAGLTGVTITNPNPEGYGLWIESSSPLVVDNTFSGNSNGGIAVKGNSSPTIRSNYFYDNGGNGIIVEGTLQADVRENVFETNSLASAVTEDSKPQLEELAPPSNPEIPTETTTTIDKPEPTNLNSIETTANNLTQNQIAPPQSATSISADSFPIPSSLPSETSTPTNVEETTISSSEQPSTVSESNTSTEPLDYSLQPSPSQVQPTGSIEISVPLPESTELSSATPPDSEPMSEIPILNPNPQANFTDQTNQAGDSVPVLSDNNSLPTQTATVQGTVYRVLVEVANEEQQELVRSLIPDAFRTSFNGQLMMQVGSFSNRERADAMRQLLNSKGLSARIEPTN
ncbi:MAG TPA: hypothetical protein DCL61_06515 [Cyanobacteria bacterium UBA12227]|nr:hypothetical protein [Cyanobacteria bacterium UBA12227]HBY79777.1 hypothetical protein [Cyanobacteria bacterium UBA11148]